jgi:predicted phage tail protein
MLNKLKTATFVVIENPIDREANKKYQLEIIDTKFLYQYLYDINPLFVNDDILVHLNGARVTDLHITLLESDVISVSCAIEVPAIVAWVMTMAFGAGAMWSTSLLFYAVYAVTYVAVTYAITTISSMIIKVLGLSNTPSLGDSTSSSPTYGWNDLQPSVQEGLPIPINFGTNRVSGQIINQYVELGNDNKEYLHVLLCVNDGEVASITDIRINDQPVTHYDGVTTDSRLGTLSQTAIDGFNELYEQRNPGIKLTYDTINTYETDGDAVEKIQIVLNARNGLGSSNDDGGLDNRSVSIEVGYRLVGGSTWTYMAATPTLSGATNENVKILVTIDNLTAAKYEVRLRRATEDSTSFKESTDVHFESFVEIVKRNLTYPGLALYSIRALATDQLSGSSPSISCLVTVSTVQVYDPYAEDWVAHTATNPAWATYALMNTYHDIIHTKFIYDEFKSWADHCDEDLDGLPRYRMSIILDAQRNIWSNVQRIADLGNGMVMRRGSYYGVFVDKADTVVSHLFTMGNIIENSYSLKWLPTKDRANSIEVTYCDPDRDYTNQVVGVYSSDYIASSKVDKKTSIQIEAAVSRAQATRKAALLLNGNKYLTKIVSFKAFVDSFTCTVGDIIYFQHDIPNYNNTSGGRIVSATTNTVTLDKQVTLTAGQGYSVLVRLEDNTMVEKAVASIPTTITTAVLHLSSTFTTIPAKDDVYLFGLTTSYKDKYRIIAITRSQHNERNITALEYNSNIYDTSSYIVDEDFDTPLSTPEAIRVYLRERLVYGASGDYQSVVDVGWVPNKYTDGSNWTVYIQNQTSPNGIVKIGDTTSLLLTVSSSYLTIGQTYKIIVCPFGKGSADVTVNTAEITVQGKLNPPSYVTGFNGTWIADQGVIIFDWTEIADIDNDGYEIRVGVTDWDTSTVVCRVGNTGTATYIVPTGSGSSLKFWIKAVDTSGIYSLSANYDTVAIGTVPAVTKTATVTLYQWSSSTPGDPSGQTTFTWSTLVNSAYTGGNGWEVSIPTNPGTPGVNLWVATKIIEAGFTAPTTTVSWTTGFSIGTVGANGATGVQSAKAIVYQWAVTIPAAPSGTSSYTWSTGLFGAAPSGWTLTPGTTPSVGYTLWAAQVPLVDSTGATATTVNWTSAGIVAVGYAGTNGATTYIWLKYADTPTSGMTDSPTGKTYMGVAYNKTTATESSTYEDYAWSLIQGSQGIQGPAGTNGATTYTWVKYASNSTGTTGFSDSPTGRTYIGLAFNKTTATESSVASDYAWSLIQGSQGIQGPAGTNGATTYIWLKYADTPTSGMTDSPTGKTYMGVAYNKTTATESSTYADYAWSLIQGSQGIQGPAGTNGTNAQPALYYDFAGATLSSGAGQNNITTSSSDSGTTTTLTSATPDPMLYLAVNLAPTACYLITANIKYVSGSWDGILFYSNSNHGIDGGRYATIPQPQIGVWTQITLDMRNVATASDFMSGGNITQLRLDFSGSSGGVVVIDWVSIGVYGIVANGASSRMMYSRIAGNPTPTTGTVTTSGSTTFPTGTNWGIAATWYSSDPTPASTNTLYQADGIYNPSTGNTVWSTPYISSLKVGSLSAVSANLGTITAGLLQTTSSNVGMKVDLTNNCILVYDASNVLRVKMGLL